MSCGSVDIPRLLTGSGKRAFLKGLQTLEAVWIVGNLLEVRTVCKSLVSQPVCQAKCHQCQQSPRSMQQQRCQHERCKNQSFPIFCDDKVAI